MRIRIQLFMLKRIRPNDEDPTVSATLLKVFTALLPYHVCLPPAVCLSSSWSSHIMFFIQLTVLFPCWSYLIMSVFHLHLSTICLSSTVVGFLLLCLSFSWLFCLPAGLTLLCLYISCVAAFTRTILFCLAAAITILFCLAAGHTKLCFSSSWYCLIKSFFKAAVTLLFCLPAPITVS